MSATHNTTKRLLEPLLWQKKLTLQSNVAYFLWGLLPVLGILFTKYLIQLLEQGIITNFHNALIIVAIIIFCYFIARFTTVNRSWVRGFWMYQKSIRTVYLKKILYIDNNQYDQIGTGNLIAIVGSGIQARSTLLVNLLRYSWSIIITLAINIYYIYQLSPRYVLVFIVSVCFILYMGVKADDRMRKYRALRREEQREGTRRIVKLFMSKFDVLQNDKIESELHHIAKTSDRAVLANEKMGTPTEIFFLGPQFIVYIFLVIFFYYGGTAVFNNSMTISFFYGVVSSLFLLQNMLDKTLTVLKDISKDRTDIEKLRSLVDNSPSIQGIEKGNTFVFNHGKIVFSDVSFGYNADRYIIEKFNLTINPGNKVALVGPSGAGKTTLIKLIAGYIQSTQGDIHIDNQLLPSATGNINAVSLKSYYKNIGYLTQEPSVFDGTIYENLIYALDYEPTNEALEFAIEQAQCSFIHDFSQGLQTHIGEKGIRLSGGQRQRLAIAKIFLKNPKIILLDEPTSALDSLSEEAITKALDKLFEGRTVVIIAHRLQTVKKADDIIVLDGGIITERGTHDQLVGIGGAYAKMLELQSGF